MTTIEDLVETALRAKFTGTYSPAWDELLTTSPGFVVAERKKMRTILSAVIEKHIRTMLVRAVDYGEARGKAGGKDLTGGSTPDAVQYAARILSALTATGRET